MSRRTSEAEVALAAESRAVEEGHRDYLTGELINGLPQGRVVSESHPTRKFIVTCIPQITGEIKFECYATDDFVHATSGKLVPCKHSALHGRRLERMGYVVWNDGRFWLPTTDGA
jgi:hypothetical protein